MYITPEIGWDQAPVNTEKPKEPKELRITLSLCSCYSNERIIFVTARAKRVAEILGLTMQELECAALTAMFLGKPEVVACYKQHDLAKSKLAQLEAEIPFIARGTHSFQLVDEE